MTGRKRDAWLIGPAGVAQRVGISIKALKLYERFGIVTPKRTLRGWRLYAEHDVDRLSHALAFRKMGFALSQIAALLDADAESLATALAAHESELNLRRADLDEAFAALRQARRRQSPTLALAA
jgi:DNA-binding transcriptional MerR regulator